MREIAIRIWDDLDYAADGTKTEAAITVELGFQGQWRELDLSEAHHTELQAFLRPYLDASRESGKYPSHQDRKPGKVSGRPSIAKFARDNGFKYRTPGGNYSYNAELRTAYAAAYPDADVKKHS